MPQNNTEIPIILPSSPESATYRADIKGWVTREGEFCGENESWARRKGATHIECSKCKAIIEKNTGCRKCRLDWEKEQYFNMPFREYDGDPCFLRDGDHFFRTEDDILEFLDDNECDEVDLVFAIEDKWYPIHLDHWDACLPDDDSAEFPQELIKLVDEFNERLKAIPSVSWVTGYDRTTYRREKSE